MTDIDSDDNFVMNIQSNNNSVPKKISLIDKRKEKREKYLERKRYKIQKKREELNDKKRVKENKNNENLNIISSFRPPRTQKPIIENYNKMSNETNIEINEENNEYSNKKFQKKKMTNNQKLKQQKHREQLISEIKDELNKINKEKNNNMIIEEEEDNKNNINEEKDKIDKTNKKESKIQESNKSNIPQSKSVFSIKTFEDLQIDQYLKKALIKNNYSTMTKIQKKSIPILLQHKNVIIKSETGSGKTLAYVIPLYEHLIKINKEESINRKSGIYTIIFAPTHELCLQIEETFNKLKSCCINIVFGTLMGGQKIDREKQKLRKGCNILICTPGRLLYHLKNTEKLNFDNLKVIIFDEADLLLNMGFEKDIKNCFIEIFKKNFENENVEIDLNPEVFKKYKIYLISATIDNKIRRFTNYLMKGFKTVGFEQEKKNNENKEENNNENNNDDNNEEIKKNPNENLENISPSNTLQQYFSYVNDEFRLITLIAFLYNNTGKKIMIFMSTCDGVNFLSNLLNQIEIDINFRIEPKELNRKQNNKLLKEKPNKRKIIKSNLYKLHGKMKHDERKEIFTKYNLDNSGILISTDVAARGLDFPNVEWVIHYDINPDLKEYVNRMGRTARLDNLGNSLLFLMENERELLNTSFNKIKGEIKEIVNSNILLEFTQNLNNNLLRNKIDFIPMPFDNEVDENEKFRKKFIFAILPLQKIVKDFIFSNKENMILAQRAFKSELKAYATFIKYGKNIFNIKVLNLTRLSRSFGLYKETSKIKIGNTQVNIDYQYEKTQVKAEKKYKNKKIQNRIMMSEFDS